MFPIEEHKMSNAYTDKFVPPLILTELIFKQRPLSDRAFAEKLGISRRLWSLTQRGERAIGITLLEAIARTYSDMDSFILGYLRGEDRARIVAETEEQTAD